MLSLLKSPARNSRILENLDRSKPSGISLEIVRSDLETYSFTRREQFPTHENLIWQITEGYVRSITWSESGEVMTLGIWGPTDFFGQSLSIVDPYQVECLTNVKAVACQPVETRMVPVLLNNVLLNNSQQTEKLLSVMQMRCMRDRLLSVLDWLSERFGQVYPMGRTIGLGLTHQQFAELAGTTRVTVTRLLHALESAGKIHRLPRRNIMLLR
jgi:CRP-like cAMP-binding protein